eukprot:scaffold358_cov343-Pavlova_lutheri.AAC.42
MGDSPRHTLDVANLDLRTAKESLRRRGMHSAMQWRNMTMHPLHSVHKKSSLEAHMDLKRST